MKTIKLQVETHYANGKPTRFPEKIMQGIIDAQKFLALHGFYSEIDYQGWEENKYPPITSMMVGSDFDGKRGDQVQFTLPDGTEFAPPVELIMVKKISIWKTKDGIKLIKLGDKKLNLPNSINLLDLCKCVPIDFYQRMMKAEKGRYFITWGAPLTTSKS